MLVAEGVHAVGFNFWPHSKRYLPRQDARSFSPDFAGQILRVGVFVNEDPADAISLVQEGLIDVVQFHGEEDQKDVECLITAGVPVIKAVGADHLPQWPMFSGNFALLIDTPAGRDFGGTGKTFDWSIARQFRQEHPEIPLLLAGGLNPDNATAALAAVSPCVLDVASGAESAPGVKDQEKVRLLQASVAGSRK